MKQIILFLLVSLLLVSPVLAYSVPDDTIVYVTPHGEKYHTSDCSYLTTYDSMTIEEAERNGYEPCSRCNPDIFVSEPIEPETSSRSDPWFSRVVSGISDFFLWIYSLVVSLLKRITIAAFGLVIFAICVVFLFTFRSLIIRFFYFLSDVLSNRTSKKNHKSNKIAKSNRTPELYYRCNTDPFYHRKDCSRLRKSSSITAVKFSKVFWLNIPPCPYCNPRNNYFDPSSY